MRLKIETSPEGETENIKLAAEKLKKGYTAILPTSTIYGISCVYSDKKALEKIYKIKKRPKKLPFIILLPKIADINYLIEEKNKVADILIKNYWKSCKPEPLTIVFKKNKKLDSIFFDSDTIALRFDLLPVLLKMLEICGPVVSTSAAISGTGVSPKNTDEIPSEIKSQVDIIVDIGRNLPGIASTVIDATENMPKLIREGMIKYDSILNLEDMKEYLKKL